MDAKPLLPGMLDRPSNRHRFFRVCQHGRSARQFIFRWWGYSCRLVWLHAGRVLQWTRKGEWDCRLYTGTEVRAIRAFHRLTSNRKNTGLQGEEQSVPDDNATKFQFAGWVSFPRLFLICWFQSRFFFLRIKTSKFSPDWFKESSGKTPMRVRFIRVISDKTTKWRCSL